ncbi:MAG: ATPase, T2SS/T4P/T4SS family [Myxococcales bacterium]|jgi:pilus assembly protein CpaF
MVCELTAPDGRVSHHRLESGGCLALGRDPTCDLVLDCELVSRRHAELHMSAGRATLRDRSANGTRIGRDRIRHDERVLRMGDELRVGRYRLRLRSAVTPGSSRPVDDAGQLAGDGGRGDRAPLPAEDEIPVELRRRVHAQLLEHLDLARFDPVDADALRPRVRQALSELCDDLRTELPETAQRVRLQRELLDEALGLGPLEDLLADASVSEIMVVEPSTIYVERAGRLELTDRRFTDAESARTTIERIVTPLGRRIDESMPLVDARLPDGSRVNAVIPPLASRGPCITIRKFPERRMTLDDLVGGRSLSPAMASLLKSAVRARKNLVVAGGTGSGKTTLLNVLSGAIPPGERVVTIEDAAELRLDQPHVVSLESRPPNMEGKGEFTIRDLVRNALRMRPDRILVGECRGGEAIDMLQAMNTGHEGSMTTTHANSPREAAQRLEMLCLMAGLDLPTTALRRQIASSVHLLVQQARFADGARRVTHVSELSGLDDHGEIEIHDIFRWDGYDFSPTGYLPTFAAQLQAAGFDPEATQ